MSTDTLRKFTAEDSLRINTFADRAPIRLSADSRFLSYIIEDRNGEVVQEQAWVTDVDSGENRQVLPEAVSVWAAGWSPIEPVSAFVADMGEGPRLWVYNAETEDVRQVSRAALAYTPFHFHLPQWMPEGSAFICTLASRIGHPGYDHLGMRISSKAASARLAGEGVSVRYWKSPGTK